MLPHWCLLTAYSVFGATLSGFFVLMLLKYVKLGTVPAKSSLMALIAMTVWFVPAIYHPVYYFMVPFFHSLQYLWFAIAFRKNKVAHQLEGLHGQEYRVGNLVSLWGYLTISVVLGALAFYGIPLVLDMSFPFGRGTPPLPLFYALFGIFFNVHHYFIDSVIWRKDNPEAGRYLLAKRA